MTSQHTNLKSASSPAQYYDQLAKEWLDWGQTASDAPIYHVHFGYSPQPTEPYHHVEALAEMTRQVTTRLDLTTQSSLQIGDLGCGSGASVFQIAQTYPQHHVLGFTISQTQARAGQAYIDTHSYTNAGVLMGDFGKLALADASLDGAFMIESFCHAHDKTQVLTDIYRVLRSGGKLVIHDFIPKIQIKEKTSFYYLTQQMYKGFGCPYFEEPIAQLLDIMTTVGFDLIASDDITAHTLASVKHAAIYHVSSSYADETSEDYLQKALGMRTSARALFNLLYNEQIGYFSIIVTKP